MPREQSPDLREELVRNLDEVCDWSSNAVILRERFILDRLLVVREEAVNACFVPPRQQLGAAGSSRSPLSAPERRERLPAS
jgi:hypothetical protein